jgi:hypothetical protein
LANAELPEELGVLDPAVDDAATGVEAVVVEGPLAENWNRLPGFDVPMADVCATVVVGVPTVASFGAANVVVGEETLPIWGFTTLDTSATDVDVAYVTSLHTLRRMT